MTDMIGNEIQVGSYVLSVQTKYRGFKWIMGIVEGLTEKRVKIKYTDLHITDSSKIETSAKAPHTLLVCDEIPKAPYTEAAELLRGKL
jgi:hypothetical protein